MTALMHAVEHGHETVVVALLEAGADISVQDGDGKTALELASSSHNSGIQALLEAYSSSRLVAASPVAKKFPVRRHSSMAAVGKLAHEGSGVEPPKDRKRSL